VRHLFFYSCFSSGSILSLDLVLHLYDIPLFGLCLVYFAFRICLSSSRTVWISFFSSSVVGVPFSPFATSSLSVRTSYNFLVFQFRMGSLAAKVLFVLVIFTFFPVETQHHFHSYFCLAWAFLHPRTAFTESSSEKSLLRETSRSTVVRASLSHESHWEIAVNSLMAT
jgi:hypothetical protein